VFLFVGLPIVAGLLAGCAGRAVPEPPLVLSVSLDRSQYDIGAPVIATVRLENRGRRAIVVPRFNNESLRFLSGPKGGDSPVRKEPLSSTEVAPETRQAGPGEIISRRFVFTRLAEQEGEYALMASFKGAVIGGEFTEETFFSKPTPFKVTGTVALRRDPADPDGAILKAQAIEIARKSVSGQVKEEKALAMPIGKSGLFYWYVLLRVQTPDGQSKTYEIPVNAYTGKVMPAEPAAPGGGDAPSAPPAKAAPGKESKCPPGNSGTDYSFHV
jgi:hypothetical protein